MGRHDGLRDAARRGSCASSALPSSEAKAGGGAGATVLGLLAIGITAVLLVGWLRAGTTPAAVPARSDVAAEPAPPRAQPAPVLAESDAVARVVGAVVRVRVSDGVGSGVVVTPDGFLLTNEHVVGRDRSASIRFRDGRTVEAAVLRADPTRDLALLRIELTGLPFATLADVAALRLGEPLLTIGYALDQPGDPSVTRGVFSALRAERAVEYVQTDAPINKGDSGGALISYRGEVAGILAFTRVGTVQGAPLQGLNFAISAREVRAFLGWHG